MKKDCCEKVLNHRSLPVFTTDPHRRGRLVGGGGGGGEPEWDNSASSSADDHKLSSSSSFEKDSARQVVRMVSGERSEVLSRERRVRLRFPDGTGAEGELVAGGKIVR